MAATEITITNLKFNTAEALPATAALDGTDGAVVDFSSAEDRRILIIIENSDSENAEDVTVKKGTGIQATEDYVVSVAAGATVCTVFESGKFKDMSSGLVNITGSADVKVAAVALP
jgi:hypothetical protein